MILRSYHNHTTFCDGKNSVEEMVRAAIGAGLHSFGISSHATYPPDLRYCIQPGAEAQYAAQVNACKEKYAGHIEIYLGVEAELYGAKPTFARDYTIGATHYMRIDGRDYYIDYSEEDQRKTIREVFGGDPYKLTAYYYETVAKYPEMLDFDFVAHFDLVTKFNEGGKIFDEEDPRYWKPALEVMAYLVEKGYAFEINTGATSRGYRTTPYPNVRLLRSLQEFGGSIVFGCDSHSVDTVTTCLVDAMELAKHCGFRSQRILTRDGWQEAAIGE